MKFEKGKSGNPGGLPKGGVPKDKSRKVLIKEAWDELCKAKPWLIKEALERGLTGGRPLGFLELGARVNKEVGSQEEQKANVTIVVQSPLNADSLKPVIEITVPPAPEAHPEVPEKPTEGNITLLEHTDA